MHPYILITGGGSGIGQALALSLANAGQHVYIVGRRAHCLTQTAAQYPDNIFPICADLSSDSGFERLLAHLPSGAQCRALVHNAATLNPLGPILEAELKQWHQAMNINVAVPFRLSKCMQSALKGGRILHISSGAAHQALAGMGVYCITKAALHMLYQSLKVELAPHIGVGSVMPGIVDTHMQTELRGDKTTDAAFFQSLKDNQQLVSPETVAAFLHWLLLDTTVSEFSAHEWDIYDSAHHRHWLGNRPTPTLDVIDA